MKFKKSSRREFASFCNEIGPEDGTDPKTFFQKSSRRRINRKALQLCGQIARTLSQVLAWESGDDRLRNLMVTAVEPAPDDSRVLVTVVLETAELTLSPGEVLELLRSCRGWLRSEIGAAIHRKRVPELAFRVLGPGEAQL
jgi:ribosome-binding factor A